MFAFKKRKQLIENNFFGVWANSPTFNKAAQLRGYKISCFYKLFKLFPNIIKTSRTSRELKTALQAFMSRAKLLTPTVSKIGSVTTSPCFALSNRYKLLDNARLFLHQGVR